MILMKNVRLDYSIHLHLQKLYTNLQNINIPELNGQKLSCSIGCAVAPTDAESFSQLYRLADHALYTAKHNGRGRFCYLPRYQEPAGNRFILINVRNSGTGQYSCHLISKFPPQILYLSGREFHSSLYLRYTTGTSSHF